jgi:hypothetical protein
MRELWQNVLHKVCAAQRELPLSRMQCQKGSSQERKRIQGSKRILESKDVRIEAIREKWGRRLERSEAQVVALNVESMDIGLRQI